MMYGEPYILENKNKRKKKRKKLKKWLKQNVKKYHVKIYKESVNPFPEKVVSGEFFMEEDKGYHIFPDNYEITKIDLKTMKLVHVYKFPYFIDESQNIPCSLYYCNIYDIKEPYIYGCLSSYSIWFVYHLELEKFVFVYSDEVNGRFIAEISRMYVVNHTLYY